MSNTKKAMVLIFLIIVSVLLISCKENNNNDFVVPSYLRMEVDDKEFVTYDKDINFPIITGSNGESIALVVTVYLQNSQKRMISSIFINGEEIKYDKFVRNTDNQIIAVEYKFSKDKIDEAESITEPKDRVLGITIDKIYYKKGATSLAIMLTENNVRLGIVNPKYTLKVMAPTADNTEKTFFVQDINFKTNMRYVLPKIGDANANADEDKLFKRDSKLEGYYTLPEAKGQRVTDADKYFFNKDITLYAHFVPLFVYEQTDTYIKITDLTVDGALENSILVPDIINNLPVLEIGKDAFRKFGGIAVQLNSTLNVIGEHAFFNLSKVNVDFDKATLLEEIGNYAFSGCTRLDNIEFSPSLKRIGNFAFERCGWASKRPAGTGSSGRLLATLIIPSTIEVIGEGAFSKATFTKLFFIARNLDGSELQNLSLDMGNNAFEKCAFLTTVRFGTKWGKSGILEDTKQTIDEIKTISEKAFFQCEALNDVFMPNNSIQEIKKLAFAKCTSLSKFELADSVKYIGEESFAGCEQLAEVINTTSSELISIGDFAFTTCSKLSEIYIRSKKLSNWGKAPFYGATKLQSIFLEAPEPKFDGDSGQLANAYLKYYVPEDYIQFYIENWKVKDNWLGGAMEVLKFFSISTILTEGQDSSGKLINKYAIKLIDTLGVKTIELLTVFTREIELNIPSELPLIYGSNTKYPVTVIGSYLAHSGLTTVIIPDTIVEIKSSAFFDCKSLKSVNGSDSLKGLTKLEKIGDNAFMRTSLTKLITPINLKEIGYRAFNGCSKLLEARIFTEVKINIKEEAFSGSSLSETHLGENVSSIGKGAFIIPSLNNIYLYGEPPTLEALTTPWSALRVTVHVKEQYLSKYQETKVYKDNKEYKIF